MNLDEFGYHANTLGHMFNVHPSFKGKETQGY